MINELSQTPIKDLQLEIGDEITIHKELLRIIERDIEKIESGDTKNGWTTWAVVTGLVASTLFLLSELQKINVFPYQEIANIVLFIFLIWQTLGFLIPQLNSIGDKPQTLKLKDSKETFAGHRIYALFRLIVNIGFLFSLFYLQFPLFTKTLTLLSLFIWIIAFLFIFIMSFVKMDYSDDKDNLFRKAFLNLLTILPAISILLIFFNLPTPLGDGSLIYKISGAIIIIFILIDVLLSISSTPRLLENLKFLRNDIIFLRSDIDTALKRYNNLVEGRTFLDSVQPNIQEVIRDIALINNCFQQFNDSLILIENEIKKSKFQITPKFHQQYVDMNNKHTILRGFIERFGQNLSLLYQQQNNAVRLTKEWETDSTVKEFISNEINKLSQLEQTTIERRVRIDGIVLPKLKDSVYIIQSSEEDTLKNQ